MTHDKKLHFAAGAIICLALGLIFTPTVGFLAAIVAGLGKEVWDILGHGTPELMDAVATITGGLIVYAVLVELVK